MATAVFCKWCPDPAGIEVRGDRSVSVARAQWAVSEYDRVAIEVAVSAAHGDVVAFTAGSAEVGTPLARKSILSRGPGALCMVVDDGLADADAHQTARALVAAVRRAGDVDLVVCGSGSADRYGQQVGVQAAELLGWPVLNEVTAVAVADGTVRVVHRSPAGLDTVEGPLPVVVAVAPDAAVPRTPGVRDVMGAGTRPTTVWSLDDLGEAARAAPSSEVLSTAAPPAAHRRQVRLAGDPAQVAAGLVEELRHQGLLGVPA
ncbi:MAG TPA: hypothetical protein VHB02_12495 [Acidimicrobiales bacterium]|nr:hypothetical protein [Acidimicrobiales bacterium]